MEKHFQSISIEDMHEVATWILSHISLGTIVFLEGELGAGKTTLVQLICKELGISGKVVSPTFTIAKPYPIQGGTLIHMDAYRLTTEEDDQEWIEMCDDHTICLIEWASHLKRHKMMHAVRVQLDITSFDSRSIKVIIPEDASHA